MTKRIGAKNRSDIASVAGKQSAGSGGKSSGRLTGDFPGIHIISSEDNARHFGSSMAPPGSEKSGEVQKNEVTKRLRSKKIDPKPSKPPPKR